jgi:hypothetical protein
VVHQEVVVHPEVQVQVDLQDQVDLQVHPEVLEQQVHREVQVLLV